MRTATKWKTLFWNKNIGVGLLPDMRKRPHHTQRRYKSVVCIFGLVSFDDTIYFIVWNFLCSLLLGLCLCEFHTSFTRHHNTCAEFSAMFLLLFLIISLCVICGSSHMNPLCLYVVYDTILLTYHPRKHSRFCYNVVPLRESLCSILPEISQKSSLFLLLNTSNQRQFNFPLFANSFCWEISRELFTFSSLTFCGLSALSFWTSITKLFSSRFHLREPCYFFSLHFAVKLFQAKFSHRFFASSLLLSDCNHSQNILLTICKTTAKPYEILGTSRLLSYELTT